MRRQTNYRTNSSIMLKEDNLLKDYETLQDSAILSIFQNILRCNTKLNVDSTVTMARYIASDGINNDNYVLYFLLLETNNNYVIDSLIGNRNEFMLFSSIKPNWYMLKRTFEILYKFKKGELNPRCLLSLLGVIQNTYKESKYGFNIYKLSISDVYNIGKFLEKNNDQLFVANRLILDVLLDIYQLGTHVGYKNEKIVALKANSIRMAFFDKRKDMSDVIPNVLLLNGGIKNKQIKPSIISEKD